MKHKPWEDENGKKVWVSEAKYWEWLRGAIRKLWSDYPLRKQWKNSQLRPVTKEERVAKVFHPSTKNVGMCVFCEEWMAGSKLECDHIIESNGCTSETTAVEFLWHNCGQTGVNFQLACKPCHKIKSHQIKKGYETFLEAKLDKDIIQWEKINKGVEKQRHLLVSYGIEDADALKAKDIRPKLLKFLMNNPDFKIL